MRCNNTNPLVHMHMHLLFDRETARALSCGLKENIWHAGSASRWLAGELCSRRDKATCGSAYARKTTANTLQPVIKVSPLVRYPRRDALLSNGTIFAAEPRQEQ